MTIATSYPMQGRSPVHLVGSQGLGYDTRTAPCNSHDGFKGHPRVKAPSSRGLPTFHPSTIESAEWAPGSWGVSVTALLKLGCTVRQIRSAPDDTLLLMPVVRAQRRCCGWSGTERRAKFEMARLLGPERPRPQLHRAWADSGLGAIKAVDPAS